MALTAWFDDPFFRTLSRTHPRQEYSRELQLLGSVDISENDHQYCITADTPGLQSKDVKVSVTDGNLLQFQGERKRERETDDKDKEGHKFHRVERSYGSFTRSFRLPEDCDPKGVRAKCEHGVLRITVPKLEKTEPESMTIDVE